MSETQAAVAPGPEVNPFDPANHSQGGGLWDGKTVTITSAVAKTEALKYGEKKGGGPVLDKKTGEPIIQTALYIKGIADGGDDKEREEVYSVGDKMAATPDGEGFTMKDGGPARFHANSNMGKFAAALKVSGFDLSVLYKDGKQRLKSGLVGARFAFKAEAKLGKDGKTLKDDKGYDKNVHLPVKFVGFATGVTRAAGNGSAAPVAGALDGKATAAVIKVLTEAGGSLTRAKLIQGIALAGATDPDTNGVLTLVVQDGFHKDKPWRYDGQQASL